MTNSGLEGVVVADTAISDVDGERGRLVIAGLDVEQLAADAQRSRPRSRACSPPAAPIASRRARRRARAAWELLPRLGDALDATDGMDALRAALAHLRVDRPTTLADALAAIGAAPVFVAAWSRKRAGPRRSRPTRRSATPPTTCA